MFRIKICGVRLKIDIAAVEQSGADAIGFNFFPPSVRYVDPDQTSTRQLSEIATELGLTRVGVFVNESAQRIASIAERVGLDAIQLHGDEPLAVADQLIRSGLRVVRAVKLPRTALSPEDLDDALAGWIEMGCHPLLDADAGSAHGGSGKTLDWQSVGRWATQHPELSWTLAGGLKPENIADAVQQTGARSVDTASGVECPRGVKNADRIHQFVERSGLTR